LLAVGLMVLCGPEAAPAQKKTQSSNQFQPLKVPQTANKLVSIEPVSMADLLTVHLNFDGKLPLHNSFILSNPPRFIIEFIGAGSALDETRVVLQDSRIKQIHTQRHPGKLRVVFDLTSLDGISYLIKEEKYRLSASFKIYVIEPPVQSAQITESPPTSFDDDATDESPADEAVKEETGFPLKEKNKDVSSGRAAVFKDSELPTEKYSLFDDEKIPPSELDTLLHEPLLPQSPFDAFLQELADGFSFELRVLAHQTVADLSDTSINPRNIFGLPKYIFQTQTRPDLYLNYGKLQLMAKPRNIMTWTRIDDGVRSGESDWDNDLFVNEWITGLQPFESLFVSYGRENIQWGPSYLDSPSNPFFRDNGLRNPKREIRGQDFGRLVWSPDTALSFSFLANTDEGADDFIDNHEKAYALKVDYTGYRSYLSIIPSYRERDRERLGAYGGWKATDGLLLYGEGTVSQGTDVLYPVETGRRFLGIPIVELEDTQDDSNNLETIALAGASYSFDLGPTLALEYFYNGTGYTDKQYDMLQDFYKGLGRIIKRLPRELLQNLFDDIDVPIDPSIKQIRKHYLNSQYLHPQLLGDLDISLRYTYNLDDNSSQLIPIAIYDLDNHLQAFVVGTQNFGDKDSEYKLFFDYSYFFGFQFTY
jgi:hypothetical protein